MESKALHGCSRKSFRLIGAYGEVNGGKVKKENDGRMSAARKGHRVLQLGGHSQAGCSGGCIEGALARDRNRGRTAPSRSRNPPSCWMGPIAPSAECPSVSTYCLLGGMDYCAGACSTGRGSKPYQLDLSKGIPKCHTSAKNSLY